MEQQNPGMAKVLSKQYVFGTVRPGGEKQLLEKAEANPQRCRIPHTSLSGGLETLKGVVRGTTAAVSKIYGIFS